MESISSKLLMLILLVTKVSFGFRTTEEVLLGARCRANCLDQFSPHATSLQECQTDNNCYMCWDMCELLLVDTFSWSPVCETEQQHLCTEGCKEACKMIFSFPSQEPKVISSTWRIPHISVVHDGSNSLVSWNTPVESRTRHNHQTPLKSSIIYVLLSNDKDSDAWHTSAISITQQVLVTGHPNKLKVVAVTSSGILTEKDPESHSRTDHLKLENLQPKVKVTKTDETINAHLTLDVTQSAQFGDLWMDWERTSCTSESETHCNLPQQMSSLVLDTSDMDQVVSIMLLELTYNSHYALDIYGVRNDEVYNIIFNTPYCPYPDASMTQCQEFTDKGPNESPQSLYIVIGVAIALFAILLVVIIVIVYCYVFHLKHEMSSSCSRKDSHDISATENSCVIDIQ